MRTRRRVPAHPGGAGPWLARDAGTDRKGTRQAGRDRSGEGRARQAQPEGSRRAERRTGIAHRSGGAAHAVLGWRGARQLQCADCSHDGSWLRHRDQGDGPAQRQWPGAADGRGERTTARAADQTHAGGHGLCAGRRYCSPQQPARNAGRCLHSPAQGSRRRQAGDAADTAKRTRKRAADDQGLAAADDHRRRQRRS